MGKFGEGANSELSTFFLLFFFLRNFFSLSADDFTISWGWGGGDFGFCSPQSKCQTKSYIPQEARASEFPKDEVASPPPPASAPALLPPPPPPKSQALSSGQGGPARLGGDPKHILPLTVMLQKLKTHLGAGRPPSVSSRKVAEEALGLSSMPRVKDAWKPSAHNPWDGGLKPDIGVTAVTHHTHKAHPPILGVPKHSSEPQARDVATPSPRL